MPILSSEIALYRSASWTDTPSTNGGRMSASAIAGVSGALFPDVYESERVAGSTKYRKGFFKINNPANLALVSPRLFVHGVAAGDHAVRMALGLQNDTEQSFLATNPDWFGCCKLKTSVLAGANSLVVVAESNTPLFRSGAKILVTSKATPDAATGVEEVATIQTVAASGTDLTIALTAPLANGYNSSSCYVCSLLEASNVQAVVDAPTVSSSGGTVNAAALAANGVGSMEATFTLTFTSGTAFNITNNAGINLSTTYGTVSSVTAPTGPFNAALFTLQPSFWAGSWQAGDTVQFAVHPAAVPVWFARDIPAASTSTASSSFSLVMDGESA